MIRSDSIGKLAEALAKAQAKIKNAKKESANPFYNSKYADLASVRDACNAELAENGLAVIQLPTTRNGKMVLEYALLHTSGEFIASEIEMNPVKSDPQGIGSAITYARRYTLAGIAGVATEDDDGNAASQQPSPHGPTKKPHSGDEEWVPPDMPTDEPTGTEADPLKDALRKKAGAKKKTAAPPPPPTPNPPPNGGNGKTPRKINADQKRRFWTRATAKKWSNDQVKQLIVTEEQVEHTEDILDGRQHYDRLIAILDKGPEAYFS
jgi:hypothetical protein